jgi:N-acetylglutamate synthase-like GNAT family acetyltransferase
MTFVIRAPIESDIEDIRKIQEAIMKRPVSDLLENRIKEYMRKDPRSCLVAEVEGSVAGFIIGDIKDWGFGVEKSGWLETIGIHPKHMGKGIGKALGEKLLEHFRSQGIKNIYTQARWDSGDLLAFFKSIGFDRSDFINLERRLEDE